jgi:MFS family permease
MNSMDSRERVGFSGAYLTLLLAHDLVMFSNSIMNPLLPLFAKELGATGAYIGFVVASYSISRIILEIPSGFISMRFGYYLPLSLGLALIALGTILSALSTMPIHLVLARMFIGLGSALFFTVSLGFIVKLFDADRRGRMLGLFKSIQFIASIVGSMVSGYVISTIGFRTSFLIAGALVVVAVLLLVISPTIRNHPREEFPEGSFSISSIGTVLRNRDILILCSATFAMFVMSGGVESTIFPIYADERLGFSFPQIGLIMGLRSLGFVVSVISMGTISDRVGRRPVMMLGLTFSALLVLLLNFTVSFPAVVAIFFGIGASVGAFWIVAPIVAAESLNPAFRGIGIGTYKTFFDLGSIVGPIVLSVLLESSGYSVCFYLASALIVVNVALTSRIKA